MNGTSPLKRCRITIEMGKPPDGVSVIQFFYRVKINLENYDVK